MTYLPENQIEIVMERDGTIEVVETDKFGSFERKVRVKRARLSKELSKGHVVARDGKFVIVKGE